MDSKKADWVDFKAIKERVSIERVLDHYGIELKRSGKNLVGLCPIHKGDNPRQFSADPEKNIFHCFKSSCKAKGNVLDFVALVEFDDKEMGSIKKAGLMIQEWFPDGSGSEKEENKEENDERQKILTDLLDDLCDRHSFENSIELTILALRLLATELDKQEIIGLIKPKPA